MRNNRRTQDLSLMLRRASLGKQTMRHTSEQASKETKRKKERKREREREEERKNPHLQPLQTDAKPPNRVTLLGALNDLGPSDVRPPWGGGRSLSRSRPRASGGRVRAHQTKAQFSLGVVQFFAKCGGWTVDLVFLGPIFCVRSQPRTPMPCDMGGFTL